jgi:hypothetical protein
MRKVLGFLVVGVLMSSSAWALVGTSIGIFGFNYNVVMKAVNTDANGNPTGTNTWVLMGTGGGMDFLVVEGPQYP